MKNDNRTEAPTPKRKRDARKKGQVARSNELTQAVGLIGTTAVLPIVVPNLARTLSQDWTEALGHAGTLQPHAAVSLLGTFALNAGMAMTPLVAVAAVTGSVASFSMAGSKPNLAMIKPKWSKVNPKQGIKKIVSKQVLWELLRTTAKLVLVFLASYAAWTVGLERLMGNPGSIGGLVSILSSSIRDLFWRVALLGLLVGVADAFVNKRRYLKDLKMTKQEVKDEHKQSEGDPQMKGAIRQKQRKLSRLRMIAAVGDADVVLTNPTHFSVALKYEEGSVAPVCVAKGAGDVALRIREEARKHGVPVLERPPLTRALYRAVDVGDVIPANLYRAVAEVLALVFRTRRRSAFRRAS